MAKKISVSLQKEHIRAVERFGKRSGINSFSGALQVIIHQFDQSQKTTEAAPKPTEKPEPQTA